VQNKAKKDGLAGVCRKCSNATIKACHEKNKARNVVVYPETKVCPGCNIQKSGMEFSKTKIEKDGLQVYCKKCTSRYHKKRKFGVSEEWFGSTLAAQGGGCAICNTLTSGGRGSFHIDHEHVEGWVKMPPEERRLYVRGLLCSNCNTGSGYFRDDIGVIGKAIDYLNGPTTGILYKEKLPKAIRDRILASQNYLCKICSTNLTTKTACVDHDHLTMIIRGILCNGCNCGLGRFHDSIELLTKVIDYLKERGATFKSQATR
jgi:Recombination endonuclease VII.